MCSNYSSFPLLFGAICGIKAQTHYYGVKLTPLHGGDYQGISYSLGPHRIPRYSQLIKGYKLQSIIIPIIPMLSYWQMAQPNGT